MNWKNVEVDGVLWRKEDKSAGEKLSVAEQEVLSRHVVHLVTWAGLGTVQGASVAFFLVIANISQVGWNLDLTLFRLCCEHFWER